MNTFINNLNDHPTLLIISFSVLIFFASGARPIDLFLTSLMMTALGAAFSQWIVFSLGFIILACITLCFVTFFSRCYSKKYKYEKQLPSETFSPQDGSGKMPRELSAKHMRLATQKLKSDIQDGKVQHTFSPEELCAIQAEEAEIPNHTWHYEPISEKFLLVGEEV